jgi:NADPH:quinone reductase-like Zn-dependent oxidoreductase
MLTAKGLTSTITEKGNLELSIVDVPVPEEVAEDEVLIRVEACPVNPSDLSTLLAGQVGQSASALAWEAKNGVTAARLSEAEVSRMKKRVGVVCGVGNECSGVVIRAGSSAAAQKLMGKVVAAAAAGKTYKQYTVVKAQMCMVFGDDVKPEQCCHAFVNPLTVMGFMDTMRKEKHKAIVHTAAASTLGQMLLKVCQEDGVDLVNVVRRREQVELLEGLGAKYVLNSSEPSFKEDLTAAIKATGATIAFDATGGGDMAQKILECMEAAQGIEDFTFYGSMVHKQVYIYGLLNPGQTTLKISEGGLGLNWGIGGFFLSMWMSKIDLETKLKAIGRVCANITTTFKAEASRQISLAEALDPAVIAGYAKQATGEKYMLMPWKDIPPPEL